MQRANGWRIQHIAGQIDELVRRFKKSYSTNHIPQIKLVNVTSVCSCRDIISCCVTWLAWPNATLRDDTAPFPRERYLPRYITAQSTKIPKTPSSSFCDQYFQAFREFFFQHFWSNLAVLSKIFFIPSQACMIKSYSLHFLLLDNNVTLTVASFDSLPNELPVIPFIVAFDLMQFQITAEQEVLKKMGEFREKIPKVKPGQKTKFQDDLVMLNELLQVRGTIWYSCLFVSFVFETLKKLVRAK